MIKHNRKEIQVNNYIEKKESTIKTPSITTDEKEKSSSILHSPVVKSKAEKEFVKKLNWTLLPLAWAIVFIQSADKSALGTAAIMGLLTDVDLSPSQYSLLGTAFCKTYNQLLACRIILGLFEAPTYPCLFMVFSSLYRRQEQSACLGFLWVSNGLGAVFVAVIIVAIIKTLDGAHGISLWRWNYIILGTITIVIVDNPHSKLLRLTEEEKTIVEERIQDNAVVKDKTVKVHHYWEALREPRFYLIMIATFANFLSIGGMVVFNKLFIKSLGFDTLETILLNIPTSIMSGLFTILAVYLHRKTKKFSIAITVSGLIAMIGCILLTVLPHTGIKLFGYYLSWGNGGSYVVILTIVSSNVSGYSKKVFYNAAVMIGYTLGNFVGPLVMLAKEAPDYRSGMIVFVAGNLVVVLSVLTIVYLMYRSNKKRLAIGVTKTDAYLDLTDREDSNFIYKL
ncbi:unnamed protein product [Cunninghamella blakesleeana]